MDIRPVGQVLLDHRRALDVPAGTSWSPRALPGGLTGLGGLPQREVQRTLLVAGRAFLGLAHLVGTLPAEATVGWVALNVVVDVTVAGGVGVAFLDELLDQRDHLGDVLGGPRLYVREVDPEEFQPLMERVGVAAYDLLPGDTFFVGLVDDLVLDVRDVLHEPDLIAPVPEIPYDHIPEQRRPGVAYVDVVVDRRTADVQADPAILSYLHHLSAQGVVNVNAHAPSL